MVMVILGGMGSLIGPIFGAFALLALEEVLSSYTQHWQVILGPILIAIVLFAKRGIYGLIPAPGTDAPAAGPPAPPPPARTPYGRCRRSRRCG